MPPPLSLLRCLPHTSYLGLFAAFSSNVIPYLAEIMYLFYFYNATTYIDQQTVVPSFWFRWWRPGFLIAGILYDVGMLAYSIYMEDIFAVLLVVRIATGLYQLSDQLWLVKRWVPFFVQKEKRRFIFFRMFLSGCICTLVICSASWTVGSWQERNDMFENVHYIMVFVIIVGCGLCYLIQGGVDFLVKYHFHWIRNVFVVLAFAGMILGIVGLIIGDGGGNNLVETLNYHSAFILIYFGLHCPTAVIVHHFMVVFEELSWKYPNPIIPPSTLSCKEATNGILSAAASKKVVCDVDILSSSIEGLRTRQTAIVVPPANHNKVAVGDIEPSNDEEKMVDKDGKEEGDLETAHDLVSQSATVSVGDAPPSVISPPVTASTRAGSILVSHQAQRRLALAFDGITRRSSVLRSNILIHQIMVVKLKRHELVCREMDKVYCIVYQLFVWEAVIWLAQTFLTLYLQSVNAPALPGHKGYYCETPLENSINSAQFVNDLVFARR